jgi:hypothetical protein
MGTLHNDQYTFKVAQFFLEWEMFQMTVIENFKVHFFIFRNIFLKSIRLWDIVEK